MIFVETKASRVAVDCNFLLSAMQFILPDIQMFSYTDVSGIFSTTTDKIKNISIL